MLYSSIFLISRKCNWKLIAIITHSFTQCEIPISGQRSEGKNYKWGGQIVRGQSDRS